MLGGFACLLPFASLIYIGMGAMMLGGGFPSPPGPGAVGGEPFTGWVFLALVGFFLLAGAVGAVLNFMAARAFASQQRRTLCLVVAGLNCLHMPLGTLLGVSTLVRPGPTHREGTLRAGSRWRLAAATPAGSPFSNPNP